MLPYPPNLKLDVVASGSKCRGCRVISRRLKPLLLIVHRDLGRLRGSVGLLLRILLGRAAAVSGFLAPVWVK